MIELAIPAGSLENALVAFRNGADAVYFGMKDFSARKAAINFSLEDLAKIRRFSFDNGKKIYVTVNTLVDDNNLQNAFQMLKQIEYYRPDGIIIQDLGLVEMIKENFPHLPLHGSTQLAIHNINGVKALKDLGFKRVVLSRELSLKEINAIRKAVPDIELKVFIHGAMCYGFSGLCMASFIKTGRSANEGSCAQVCRTWFTDKQSGRKFHPFSLKDLEAGESILELDELAIESAKVEGRLKGNEYVASVTRFYRSLLDGHRDIKMMHRTTFSRQRGNGYFQYCGPDHNRLTTCSYTGHMGILAGYLEKQSGRKIYINRECRINDHDGLMYLKKGGPDLVEAVKFPAKTLSDGALLLPSSERLETRTAIYKISDSTLNEKKPGLDIPEEKRLTPCNVQIAEKAVSLESAGIKREYEVDIEPSLNSEGEQRLKMILSQRGEGKNALEIERIDNLYPGKNFFINPKDMKNIRRDFCQALDKINDERTYRITSIEEDQGFVLPPRSAISSKHTPFQTDGIEIAGTTYITLDAVIYDEEKYYRRLEEKLEKMKGPVMIGLNNIGQVLFAKGHSQYGYFADIYLYLSNRECAKLLKNILQDNLKGGYLWIERADYESPWPFTPTIEKNFIPPLFISRSCYRHDSLGLDCKGCKKEHLFQLEQNGEEYEAYVKDCCTYVNKK